MDAIVDVPRWKAHVTWPSCDQQRCDSQHEKQRALGRSEAHTAAQEHATIDWYAWGNC